MPEESKSKFDAFVAKVVGDPAKPQETLMLQGFLGASSEANHTRIYTDPTLESYVDVANGDIVHTEAISKEESPLGGYYVWVKKSAEAVTGKPGAERKKAKFLEGPIAQAAAGIGAVGPAPAPGVTVPLLACHPTLVVQFCKTHLPPFCPPPSPFPWQCGISHFPVFCPPSPLIHCPPSPFIHCPPSPPPLLCPQTPLCPTGPAGCPPLTVNQQQCVASGGGIGCPVDTPLTPQTPQIGGGGIGVQAAAALAQPGVVPQLQPTLLWACQPIHSVFLACPSVPIWHCPSIPIICRHTALIACQTIFQPQCLPVLTAACPVVSAACPQGPGPVFGEFAQAAAAAAPQIAPIPQSLTAPCLTVAATACGCPSHFPPLCPTPLCPSQHGFHCPTLNAYHCPTLNQYHCQSIQHWHCPTPACPTPQCPTNLCTEIGPHCNPTPNPVHCPTPNMMCPPPTGSFQCPSVGEICPTSSPLFCAAAPNIGQAGLAAQAAGPVPQPIQVQPSLVLQCRPSVFCPVTYYPHYCPVTYQPWCHPRTLAGVQCFTPFCPIATAICPPQQSLACGPGGFGGVPGF